MTVNRIAFASLALGLALFAGSASAQEYTRRSFLVTPGHVELTGEPARPQLVRIDVSSNGNDPNPVFLAPHVYFGVTSDLTLGITHQDGICVASCGNRVYRDAGFGLLYNLVRAANFELDLNTGLQVRNFDPFTMGAKGGVLGRLNFGIVGFVFDPSLYIGFNRRDQGNRQQLVLPFWFYFQASRTVVPFVGAMVVAPIDYYDHGTSVPVEGGVIFSVSRDVDLGFYFRFSNLLGQGGSFDWRELGMLARFRF